MTPWLSVVIPVHDGERWLGETFDSLVGQEPGFECVVVDSSPGDGTAALARRYGDRLDLRILRRPDLAHWRAKTNFGFSQAEAAHVAMLHQDDVWLPGRGARVRAWIAADPGAAMHVHPARLIDAKGRAIGVWRAPLPERDGVVPAADLLAKLLVQNFVAVPTPVIRADAYARVGGIREDLWYTGDWDLYLKLARQGTVVFHPEVLAGFRIHGHSMTASGSRDAAAFEAQMRTVLATHAPALAEPGAGAVLRRARASIAVNTALAAASHGDRAAPLRAARAILGLGPRGARAYLHEARLMDRLLPRLRVRLRPGGRRPPNAPGPTAGRDQRRSG